MNVRADSYFEYKEIILLAGAARGWNMDREIVKIWAGPIEDLPEVYTMKGVPVGCVNVAIYSDGSRIYDKGFALSKAFQDKINFRMSRCWDSLREEDQEV